VGQPFAVARFFVNLHTFNSSVAKMDGTTVVGGAEVDWDFGLLLNLKCRVRTLAAGNGAQL
jgi:hypothetical protein